MKRRLVLLIVIALLAFASGCGSGLKQATMEECAYTFIEAMIAEDEKKIDAINNMSSLVMTTSQIMDEAEDFKGYEKDDFTLDINEGKDCIVLDSTDGNIHYIMYFDELGGKYYISSLW
jgi:uncharacterized protein YceK